MPNPALEIPDTMKLIVDRSPELLRNAVLPDTPLMVPGGSKLKVQHHVISVSPWEGEPGNPAKCPIAVAIGRLLDVTEMHIEGEKPWFKTRDGRKHNLSITADVALWVGRYDRNEPVMPFDLTLDILG